MLQDASKELKQIIQDLKDDELKLAPLSSQLKRVPELIQETIKNLEEDEQELNENYDEILAQPEEK